MSCARFEWLSGYADHALASDEAATLERHLFTCADCRRDYRALRELRDALRAEPEPAPLPLRIELSLTAMAQRFVDGEAPQGATAEACSASFAAPREPTLHDGWTRPWKQLAAASAIAALAIFGMGVFANRGVQVPALSVVEHRVAGLSGFGHTALHSHLDHSAHARRTAVDTSRALQRLVDKRSAFAAPLPSDRRFGAPLDARVLDLDGVAVVMADYRLGNTPVTLFLLPAEVAMDRFDLEVEAVADACTLQAVHQCYQDDVGTGLCVTTARDLAYVWVAQLPLASLDKLVRWRH